MHEISKTDGWNLRVLRVVKLFTKQAINSLICKYEYEIYTHEYKNLK